MARGARNRGTSGKGGDCSSVQRCGRKTRRASLIIETNEYIFARISFMRIEANARERCVPQRRIRETQRRSFVSSYIFHVYASQGGLWTPEWRLARLVSRPLTVSQPNERRKISDNKKISKIRDLFTNRNAHTSRSQTLNGFIHFSREKM